MGGSDLQHRRSRAPPLENSTAPQGPSVGKFHGTSTKTPLGISSKDILDHQYLRTLVKLRQFHSLNFSHLLSCQTLQDEKVA